MEMNKYQEALELIKESYGEGEFHYNYDEIDTLKELVNKSKPMKVFETDHSYICRNCANIFTMKYEGMCVPCLHGIKYCPSCGQAQDWGDVNA